MNEMPELKPGMLVTRKNNGNIYRYIVIRAIPKNPFVAFNMYTMKENTFYGDVIDEVYEYKDAHHGSSGASMHLGYGLIWKRQQPKEMTVAEISKELGYPIKVVE